MTENATHQALVTPPRSARPKRPLRIGLVTSDRRDKTIAVAVPFQARHPKYGKYLRRNIVLHAHDEHNQAALGDTVEICECRPISKTKRWRLVRIIGSPRRAGGPAT